METRLRDVEKTVEVVKTTLEISLNNLEKSLSERDKNFEKHTAEEMENLKSIRDAINKLTLESSKQNWKLLIGLSAVAIGAENLDKLSPFITALFPF